MTMFDSLTEAFDPVPVVWDESLTRVKAETRIGDSEISAMFMLDADQHWLFLYSSRDAQKKNSRPTYMPTGKGGSSNMKILGFVISCIEKFLQEKKPQSISFSGSKDTGLAAMYTAMVKRIEPRAEAAGYKVGLHNERTDIRFVIQRKKSI